jgi:GH25 family lysozyme M1 (1,4-beta-N-acetylmuramidase)
MKRRRPFHFLALDFETAYNKKSAGFALDAKEWIDHVAQESGLKVLLYTNPSTYREWLMPYGTWQRSYPLWIAQYYYFPSHTKNPSMYGMDRDDWDIYQYTAKGKGSAYGVGSASVDLNVYKSTYADMRNRFKANETPAPIPQPPQDDGRLKALQDEVQAALDKSRRE